MRRFLFTLSLLVSIPAEAGAQAIARSHVSLEAPQVRLADLFDNAGPRGDAVLGPAPAPGQRYVVPVAQLAAIARDAGLTLTGGGPTVVERPGRPVAREEVDATLRAALAEAGVARGPDARIELSSFTPPTVPMGTSPQLLVEDLVTDQATGRFVATLTAILPGEQPVRARLAGRVVELVAIPVAVRRLGAGASLTESDVRMAQLPPDRVPADAVRDLAELQGQVLRRPLTPGAPIGRSELGGRLQVLKDGAVVMSIELPGLVVTAQGRALENGARGDVIQVVNIASRAVIEATVVGPGRVRVTPGSLPVSRPTERHAANRRQEPLR